MKRFTISEALRERLGNWFIIGMCIAFLVHFAYLWTYPSVYIYESNRGILIAETVLVGIMFLLSIERARKDWRRPRNWEELKEIAGDIYLFGLSVALGVHFALIWSCGIVMVQMSYGALAVYTTLVFIGLVLGIERDIRDSQREGYGG
ncbi:MAG TPA: hypothetical protein VMW64_07510 [Dehalococcoidia bacterium]|nr:hypothetical protein [Dehalococcoidia bacterium]